MRIIDVHTHVFPQYADLAVEVMDRCGVERCVTLEWHDGFGETLRRHLELFNRYAGRFIVFGNVDWSRINQRGFGERAARQMERDASAGMRGFKVYKALGLSYRRRNGQLWRVNDRQFDPIWATAGALKLPVLLHTADPIGFWQPVNERNFWDNVLYGEYDGWTYYRKGLPSREELLAERNEVVARHHKTVFLCPHVGSMSECLDGAAEDLEALPNLYYDFSARTPELGRTPERAARARQFFLKYADRMLFGTDMIYDDTYVPAGQQAQLLFQPGKVIRDKDEARRRCADESVACFRSHLEFLTGDDAQRKPPFCRSKKPYTTTNLHLPKSVCEKILYGNAKRLLHL